MKAAEVIAIYDAMSDNYDRDRGKALMEKPYLDEVVKAIPAGGRVLDLGCGTGEPIARYLIEQGLDLTGVDGARRMIEICRQRFPDSEWLRVDMRDLQLGQKFDALIAWDSLFHLNPSDQQYLFSRLATHLRPGGILLFTSGHTAGETFGTIAEKKVYHASLATDTYRELLQTNGFQVLSHVVEDPDCGFHTVWLARLE